jgi:hypothetical protein
MKTYRTSPKRVSTAEIKKRLRAAFDKIDARAVEHIEANCDSPWPFADTFPSDHACCYNGKMAIHDLIWAFADLFDGRLNEWQEFISTEGMKRATAALEKKYPCIAEDPK